MKVREIIRLIEKDGWFFVRQRGSHRQFKHSFKSGMVTFQVKKVMILKKEQRTAF
ncbi:MAG: type II toxin-antitoxin system HicA family toxin [Chitinophagaceae bacterium]